MAEGALECVRLDKWLWAVRCFKTRSTAAEACKGNRVKLNDRRVKPSATVREGDKVEVQQNHLERTLIVKALLEKRVAAAALGPYIEDVTPAEAIAEAAEKREQARLFAAGRKARPTKRDLRQIRRLLDQDG